MTVELGNMLQLQWNMRGTEGSFIAPGFSLGFSEIYITRYRENRQSGTVSRIWGLGGSCELSRIGGSGGHSPHTIRGGKLECLGEKLECFFFFGGGGGGEAPPPPPPPKHWIEPCGPQCRDSCSKPRRILVGTKWKRLFRSWKHFITCLSLSEVSLYNHTNFETECSQILPLHTLINRTSFFWLQAWV